MKPKLFIGSSGEARDFATAIHAELKTVAECTVWTEGAFGLTEHTVEGLMRNLRDSDFGVFVFAPDDSTQLRGEFLKVPRDNVVFEAGLFSGYLGPQRCFVVVPQDTSVHLPSDMLGITVGSYEENRSDLNRRAAVATFCEEVRNRVRRDGAFQGAAHEGLRELCIKFECCDWITDENNRIERKEAVSSEIDRFCQAYPVNKHRLLHQERKGYYIALFSAVRSHPEARDWELVKQIRTDKLPPGFAYYKLMAAVEVLKTQKKMTSSQLEELQGWLRTLGKADTNITARISSLTS